MKAVQEKADCIGRTVKSVAWGDNDQQVVIAFDDDTFLALRSVRVGDETEIELLKSFDTHYWQFADLEEAFGKPAAMAMHKEDVERREAQDRKWRQAEKARLQERLRYLETSE